MSRIPSHKKPTDRQQLGHACNFEGLRPPQDHGYVQPEVYPPHPGLNVRQPYHHTYGVHVWNPRQLPGYDFQGSFSQGYGYGTQHAFGAPRYGPDVYFGEDRPAYGGFDIGRAAQDFVPEMPRDTGHRPGSKNGFRAQRNTQNDGGHAPKDDMPKMPKQRDPFAAPRAHLSYAYNEQRSVGTPEVQDTTCTFSDPILVSSNESMQEHHNASPSPINDQRASTEDEPAFKYDHPSTREYPNGNVEYSITVTGEVEPYVDRGVSWASVVYSHKLTKNGHTWMKSCLGVYKCPVKACPYVERPRVPTRKYKYAPPLPPKTLCVKHKCELEHLDCQATLKMNINLSPSSMIHKGFHDHPKPYPIRPDAESRKKIEIAPQVQPKQLLMGTYTGPSIAETHPSMANPSRLAQFRRKTIKHPTASTLDSIASFEEKVGESVFCSTGFKRDHGHISIQTSFLAEISASINGGMQTGLHSWFPSCSARLRSITLFISDYSSRHSHKSWEDFQNDFPGMTCDFSEAEHVGIEHALRRPCSLDQDEDLRMERRDFPLTKPWLDWYLHPSRSKLIFIALADANVSTIAKNTNAQESLGNDFLRIVLKPKLTIYEAVEHSYSYVALIKRDHDYALKGVKLRYGKVESLAASSPKKRKRFDNDGQAPDATKTLLKGPTRQRQQGNPRLGSDLDWSTHHGTHGAILKK
ncbi:hypothetical protein B0O80DRAFT_524762 [Mortierella sp. GBAus27b]|nr:hypothetical protein B0O80DRAFT_524762 [Mortierella sp. GBAus27b]